MRTLNKTSRIPLRVNDVVCLKPSIRSRREFDAAIIVRFYSDVPGGVVLDRYLEGSQAWNVQDLMRASRKRLAILPGKVTRKSV